MVFLSQWFERVSQTIAPDKNYQQPEKPESFLLDFVAPPSEELSISTPTGSPNTTKAAKPLVTCVHCHKETPVPSQSTTFRTPGKGKVVGLSDNSSTNSFRRSVEEISEEQKGDIIQAAFETKAIVFESKTFQEKLDAQFKRIAADTAVKGKSIDKLKTILRKDKERTQASGRIPLVFARSNRLYTTSVSIVPDGFTLLHAAAMFSQVEFVKALLEDPDWRAEQLQRTTLLGESAITVASIYGKPKMVEFLKQYYPDQNDVDVGGLTAYGNAMTSPVNTRKREFQQFFSPSDASIMTSGKKSVPVDNWSPLGVRLGAENIFGLRCKNEDAYEARVWNEDDQCVGYACVCDGHEDGGEVSGYVSSNLYYALQKYHDVSDWTQRLEKACSDLDSELKETHPKNGGSTAIFTLLTQKKIVVGNVGDSRCILIQRGATKEEDLSDAMANLSLKESGQFTVTAMSKDHTIEGDELERLKKDGAKVKEETYKDANGNLVTKHKLDNGKSLLAMSRAFGDYEYKEGAGLICTPEVVIRDRDFEKDAYLVLACDGVFDVMSNEDLARMVVEQAASKPTINSDTLNEVAHYVSTQCVKSGDNITVIILSLHDLPSAVSSPAGLPTVSTVESPQK